MAGLKLTARKFPLLTVYKSFQRQKMSELFLNPNPTSKVPDQSLSTKRLVEKEIFGNVNFKTKHPKNTGGQFENLGNLNP
jgi:hypothetical protein